MQFDEEATSVKWSVVVGWVSRGLRYQEPTASNSAIANKANLRLPSGWRNGKTWGNRDFDVYLAIQDVAFDKDAQ